ncbi:VARLMGL domain-containing protein [Heracleum sosnowskyi]|uniref:VARLMGL domain-containing protein n=1 Tax=Heracleum sosnowskyi TaxID=360622 RepID=A0AAD8M7Z1_9APIA|nr:VARLMGL domain-containing protein [Heracleum sosnowskyi]
MTIFQDSEDDSTKSCFSGILRRVLCTGSLPTHPSNSDSVLESDKVILENKNIQVDGQGTPGVVARLMGLDSLPDIKWIPNDTINFRSRSVSSADYFPKFDYLLQESQHRRVKTSVSFRETPTFVHQQNEDLFVLCFDETNNKNASGLRMITSPDEVVGFQDSKNVKRSSRRVAVKKKEKQQNKKNNLQPKRSCLKADNILPYYNKSNEVYIRSSSRLKKKRPTKPPNSFCEEVSSGMKHARIRTNTRPTSHARIESSSNTGSSSESSTKTSEISRKIGLNSNTKKNSIPKPEKVEYPCPSNSYRRSNGSDDQEVTSANQITKSDGLMKSKEIDFLYMKNFFEVCRLNEEDTKNSHDWRWIKTETVKFEDSEDICLDFEQHILDMLLQQVVDELC